MKILGLLLFFITSTSFAMPPSNYLLDFSKNSETLKESRAQKKKAKADLEASDNLWATSLGAEVGYLDYKTETLTESVQTGVQSTASISQSSPLGLTAAFTATYFEDDDREATESFSASIEQNIWRNAFGGADRNALKAAEKNYEAESLEADLNAYKACDEAYSLYFTTWRAQEKLRILKDVLKLSERNFSITRRNYRRKLIRRLEFQSAEVDHIGVKDRVLAAENEWARESENYRRYSKLNDTLIYAFKPIPLSGSSSLLKSEVSRLKYEALELLKNKERSESRTDVSLFADLEFSDAPSVTGTTTTETETYLVGVRFDFPWLDRAVSGQYKAAIADAAQAEQVWIKLEADERVQVEYFTKLLKEIEQNLVRHEERQRLRTSQVKQAIKYLNTGRMEFDDYLRYRNGELEEKLRGLELIKNYWDTRLDLMQSTGDGAKKLCRGFLDA